MAETNQKFQRTSGRFFASYPAARKGRKELTETLGLKGDENSDVSRIRIRRRQGAFELVQYDRITEKKPTAKKETK